MHSIALVAASVSMLVIPAIQDRALLFLPMLGIGLAWGSMMGNPYVMLSDAIPRERVGVYMGVFNMFIVIPMLIQNLTLPLFYDSLLGGNPAHVIRLAGALLGCAAMACAFVTVKRADATS
jgi:maltose/moltooligosaccharide transporter